MTNRTVLQGLNSKDSYNVYVKICNTAKKCSSWGTSYSIKEMSGWYLKKRELCIIKKKNAIIAEDDELFSKKISANGPEDRLNFF